MKGLLGGRWSIDRYANRSERRNQNECDEEGKEGYFVEVFLIVSIIFWCILMKLYLRQKKSPVVPSLRQANPIDVQMS
jgi:hypothetical protein